jgi:hypothetical protein
MGCVSGCVVCDGVCFCVYWLFGWAIVDKHLVLILYYGLYSRRACGVFLKVFTFLSCEKVVVRSRCVVVLCLCVVGLWFFCLCVGCLGVVWL